MVFLSPRYRKGFTLFEMLLGLAIAIPLVYGATLLALAIAKASVDELVTASFVSPADGRSTALSVYRNPCAAVEAKAVAYHATLSSKLSKSTSTYLFGAENVSSSGSAGETSSYVQVGALATPGWVELAPTNTQRSAREFLESYRAVLGEALPTLSADNFSLVVVGTLPSGELRVTAVAQVVCAAASILSKGDALPDGYLQWARLWTAEGYLEYAWIMPARREGNQPWKPHASQYWMRLDEAREIYDPGLAICRFPDPVPALDASDTVGVGLARFIYAL